MFSLNSRKDSFRLRIPKEFIPERLLIKYSKILEKENSFIKDPVEFLNESIQQIDVLGVSDATINQSQTGLGYPGEDSNELLYAASQFNYRSPSSPLKLIDKSMNIYFRHSLGYISYFLIMEIFWEAYKRNTNSDSISYQFNVDIVNYDGQILSRCVIYNPLIDAIDCLSFDYRKPLAESDTFKVIFKYNNFEYQYLPDN